MERRVLALIVISVVTSAALIAIGVAIGHGVLAPPRQPYVAVVKLRGMVLEHAPEPAFLWGRAITPDEVSYYAKRVLEDPAAKAVVISINSPGGSPASCEDIYKILTRLNEEKPVVVYGSELMASGGYYIALPASKIVASPGCITGSVGAIFMRVDASRLLERLGIEFVVIKSGDLKDIGAFHRPMTPEEEAMLRGIVDEIAGEFVKRVRARRPKVADEVFRAGIYVGEQAKEVGLVDYVGTFEDAVKIARELAGLPPDAPTIEVEKPKRPFIFPFFPLDELIWRLLRIPTLSNDLVFLRTGVYYLWLPGLRLPLDEAVVAGSMSISRP